MMDNRPPFDPIRSCFWLIAGILGVHALIVLIGVGWCVWHGDAIVEGRFKCDSIGSHMTELLGAALAAALAFAGGFGRRGDK